MTTAMAKVLVEGLDTEGVEDVWAKLNNANKTEHREASPEGILACEDPERLMEKKEAAREKEPLAYAGRQLLLSGEV